MGELGAFLKIERHGVTYRDAQERLADYDEFLVERPAEELAEQGARCMECGVPFCHNGCPLGNLIPDWNDSVYRGRFSDAIKQLHATNNFPEFTGRLCPAPCEAACVLEIREGDAVTIKQIENSIIDRAWAEGWVQPEPPEAAILTGRTVAVVGAGPAGLAAAQQLRRAGHEVTLFERDEAAGGLVRFGVPDFKIEKHVVERRVQQLVAEGVELRCGVDVGVDITAEELRTQFDAVVLATAIDATPADATPADATPSNARPTAAALHEAPRSLRGGASITLATLVLDAPALDAAPRGSGVIVAAGAPGIRAKALTHATAKWAWLREAADGKHVVRLSYETAPATDAELRELARRDSAALLGVALAPADVVAFDRTTWPGASSGDSPSRHGMGPTLASGVSTPFGIVHIGERVAGTGLQAIITHTTEQANTLIHDLAAQPGLRLT